MFRGLFSKIFGQARSRKNSKDRHASSKNDQPKGNVKGKDGGGHTTKHHRNGGAEPTPTRPDNRRAPDVPNKPRTGPTSATKPPLVSELVANTIHQYMRDYGRHQQMDLVILEGDLSIDSRQYRPRHNKIRFTCNTDVPWSGSLGKKIADALEQWSAGSNYQETEPWAPDDRLDIPVWNRLHKEASEDAEVIAKAKYVRIMSAPPSWRICKALNLNAQKEAAQLLKRYISIHKQDLNDALATENRNNRGERKNIRMLPYYNCGQKYSATMVSIDQISEWSKEYHFGRAYANAYEFDKYCCERSARQGHRHLICASLSAPRNATSSHVESRSRSRGRSTNKAGSQEQRNRNDSAVGFLSSDQSTEPREQGLKRGAQNLPRRKAPSARDARTTTERRREQETERGRNIHPKSIKTDNGQEASTALNPQREVKRSAYTATGGSQSRPPPVIEKKPNKGHEGNTHPASKGLGSKDVNKGGKERREASTRSRGSSAHSGVIHQSRKAPVRTDSPHSWEGGAHSGESHKRPAVSVNYTQSQTGGGSYGLPSREYRGPSPQRPSNRSLTVDPRDYGSNGRSPRKSPSAKSTTGKSPHSASSYQGSTPKKPPTIDTRSADRGDSLHDPISPWSEAEKRAFERSLPDSRSPVSPI